MGFGLQWIVDKIAFPSPPSSYSLTSHPELFFVKSPKSRPSYPGVPCMLYSIPQGAPVLLVHAHSNGCDIGDMRQTLQSISESLRVHVMSFEFPGYGLHVGSASMRSIDETAVAVADFLINELQVNIAQVVWYGRSIGSGPAVRMVHRITKELGQQPGGVILQCGYANFPEVAGHLFGRVAKQLVSPLWRNEAMVKDLRCPVLLIHGRNDTMIPIEQSEKLWKAVALKDVSCFNPCDCGHNDFNFRRCTLRPIYDFLLGVISSPGFPSTNFHMSISSNTHACVHHIGPLRQKIPVYSFRRPELEQWVHKLYAMHTGASEGSLEGPGGALAGSDAADAEESLKADVRELKVAPSNPSDGASGGRLPSEGAPSGSGAALSASPKRASSKGKKAKEPPPFPDFTTLPPVKDAAHALLDSEGMVRTCAQRISKFLDRFQRQLDRVEGLESKPLEEVVQLAEAEFWACDPLYSLWEEVRVTTGEHIRFRLGPFAIDNAGNRSYEPELSGSSQPNVLRVPVWVFAPSPAHFRCLAEWSLLHSERLERNLPTAAGTGGSGGCCCMPSSGLRRKKRPQSRGRRGDVRPHPTMGVLATSFAAHFVHWVERMDEIRGLFARFASLYQSPQEALSRSAGGSSSAPAGSKPLEPKELLSDLPPMSPGGSCSDEEVVGPPVGTKLTDASGKFPGKVPHLTSQTSPPLVAQPPWEPAAFSASSRAFLREGIGAVGSDLGELLEAIGVAPQPGQVRSQPRTSSKEEAAAAKGPAPREGSRESEEEVVPNVCDFRVMSQAAAELGEDAAFLPERRDWAAAAFLLHYERLLWGTSETKEAPAGATEAEAWGDPLRAEMRNTGLGIARSIKAFAHIEHQRKRECIRRGLGQMATRIPQQPTDPDGDPEVPDAPAAGQGEGQSVEEAATALA